MKKNQKKYVFVPCLKFTQLLFAANNNLKSVDNELIIICIDYRCSLNYVIKLKIDKNNGAVSFYIYSKINIDRIIYILKFLKIMLLNYIP